MPPAYLRYSDDLEVRQPDEDALVREIVERFASLNRMAFDKHRHAVRDAHAKSHGILRGELRLYDNLPPELRQGLFAEPKTYPVMARLSTSPGDIMPDGVSAFRGFALKVIGVEGEKVLPELADALTQDFLLVNNPTIPTGDVKAYRDAQKRLAGQAGLPEEVQQAVSTVARTVQKGLDAVGLDSIQLGAVGQSKPMTHILGETFFTMAALRYGDYVAKLRVEPASAELQPLRGQEIDAADNPSALRDLVVAFFQQHGAEYELSAQLCTDLEKMPIEDGSVEWPEAESPYRPVGRLVFPPQDAYSPARRVFADDVLSFNPWHCLPAHRPLGSIQRVRRAAYDASSQFRHQQNAQPRTEPRHIDELPD